MGENFFRDARCSSARKFAFARARDGGIGLFSTSGRYFHVKVSLMEWKFCIFHVDGLNLGIVMLRVSSGALCVESISCEVKDVDRQKMRNFIS